MKKIIFISCMILSMIFISCEDDKVEKFIKIVANKLKQGSLFIIGQHDTSNTFIDRHLLENQFIKIFEHVYQKL